MLGTCDTYMHTAKQTFTFVRPLVQWCDVWACVRARVCVRVCVCVSVCKMQPVLVHGALAQIVVATATSHIYMHTLYFLSAPL